MRVVVFGGTTEGRLLSHRLADLGAAVTVCVATDYGSEEQGDRPGIRKRAGPMSPEEMERLVAGADLCVDATHPYAVHVTASVRRACARTGTEYRRLLRRESAPVSDSVTVESAEEAARLLAGTQGNILLTTGAKELPPFGVLPPERLFPRILPTHKGLSACEALGIPHRNIIAMQGPFTRALNAALIRQFEIACLVTKDGGAPGGFPEKAAAARETGAKLIVIRRPEETGQSFGEILALCEEKLREKTRIP